MTDALNATTRGEFGLGWVVRAYTEAYQMKNSRLKQGLNLPKSLCLPFDAFDGTSVMQTGYQVVGPLLLLDWGVILINDITVPKDPTKISLPVLH